ncbi:MAG: high-potential iron-sulfur protein [Deltaproteobacteria bacterium]|nr:high-potential iron-sulfur protein [Deltaproteobacteria bacterium]MBI3293458.1 high-potential iron-sulfur protein [Deltaproteobacteria bacterium]
MRWFFSALLVALVGRAASPAKLPPLIDEKKNPEAVKIHFVQDGRKGKGRTDPKAYCRNCTEYTPLGKMESDGVGRCNLLTGGSVKSTAWCSSWVMNPDLYKKSS